MWRLSFSPSWKRIENSFSPIRRARPPVAARASSFRRAAIWRSKGSPSDSSRPGPTGWKRPGSSTSSECRARGWSWLAWRGRVGSRSSFRRSAGSNLARSPRSRPAACEWPATWPGGASRSSSRAGRAGGARCSTWRTRSCRTRRPRRASSSGCSGPIRARSTSCRTASSLDSPRPRPSGSDRGSTFRTSCSTLAGSSPARTCSA